MASPERPRRTRPASSEPVGGTRSLRARNRPDNSQTPTPSTGPTPEPSSVSRKRVKAAHKPEVMEHIRASLAYKFFVDLVDHLYAKPQADGFRQPVLDLWTEDAVPGYLDIVETPMDLGTIKARLKEGYYNRFRPDNSFLDEDSVMHDICLTFTNCMDYNEPDSDFYRIAESLLNYSKEAFKPRLAEREKEVRKREQMRRERRAQLDRERRARHKAVKEAEREEEEKKQREEEERRKREEEKKERKRIRDKERRDRIKAEEERKRQRDAERYAERKRIAQAEAAARAEREAKEAAERAARAAVRSAPSDMEVEDDEEGGTKSAKKRSNELANGNGNLSDIPRKKRRPDPDERSTSSISSEEAAEIEEEMGLFEEERDLCITFVSTKGMEKKRGRKSALAFQLEARHEELMRQRKVIVETKVELDKRRHLEMTQKEKEDLCAKVAVLDFIRMKCVCQIIANGLNRPELLHENEIDIDVESIDNRILREIQVFLENPVVAKLQENLRFIEKTLTDIEAEYISLRYQPAGFGRRMM